LLPCRDGIHVNTILAEGIGKCQAEIPEGGIETRLDAIAAAAKNVRSAGLGKERSTLLLD